MALSTGCASSSSHCSYLYMRDRAPENIFAPSQPYDWRKEWRAEVRRMWGLRGLTGRSGAESFVKVGDVRPALVYQSMLNRFFVGRTDVFALPARQEALASFSNPRGSGRRTFIQAMSVTSNMGRRAIFWFDAATNVPLKTSQKVANAHRGADQLPKSLVQFGFAPSVPVSAGVDVFERLLVGKQTLLLDQEGKYILDPGHNHSVHFPPLDRDDEIDVAVAWWEEPLR